MPVENIVVVVFFLLTMMAGYHFFPQKPGRLASVLAILLALFAGAGCFVARVRK